MTAVEVLATEEDFFGDLAPLVADDLAGFVREQDRHRSLTVVRDPGDLDAIGETRRWLDRVRADVGGVEPCTAMRRAVERWADGSRDSQMRGVLHTIRLDDAGHRGLAQALDQLWGVRAEDGRDFQRLVESGRRKVIATPNRAWTHGCRCAGAPGAARVIDRVPAAPAAEHDAQAHDDAPEDGVGITDTPEPPRRALPLQSFAELAAEVDAAGDPQWLVRGLIPAGDYGVIGGESKTQKTWNALDLAVSAASGTPWLGALPVDTSGPVIVFIGEGGKRNTVRRIRATAEAHGVRAEDLPIHVCVRAPKLADAGHVAELEDMVTEIRPVLVVLDPLYLAAAGADKGDLYGMGALLERPQVICQAHGAALLVVHHFNRQQGAGRARLAGAGPAEWGRFLITARVHVSEVFAENKRSRTVTYLDAVGGEIPDQTWQVERYVWADDPDDLGSPLHIDVTAKDVTGDQADEVDTPARSVEQSAELEAAVLAAVAEIHAGGHDVTTNAVRAVVPGRATLVNAALERLVISGRLTRATGRRGAHLHHPVTESQDQDEQND